MSREPLQGRPMRLPTGWGVGEELTKSWPTFEQLCVQSLPRRFLTVFLRPRARTKIRLARSRPRVGHGLPTFNTNISVLKLQGSFFRSGKLQNECFPNFSKFSSRNLLRIFPELLSFCASFRERRRPEKNHQNSPPFFNAKFPGKFEEKIHKSFLESGQNNLSCSSPLATQKWRGRSSGHAVGKVKSTLLLFWGWAFVLKLLRLATIYTEQMDTAVLGGQAAGGDPKAFSRLKQPLLYLVRCWRSTHSCFSGSPRVARGVSSSLRPKPSTSIDTRRLAWHMTALHATSFHDYSL